MNRIHLLAISMALTLPALAQAQTINRGVEGSPHDFSGTNYTWNTRRGICSPCHAAHNTDPSQIIPLWAHATSTAAFRMYSSPSMNATMGSMPTGTSLACLSCHDGTLSLNAGIGSTNNTYLIDPAAQIGPDLHTTHPISFTYDAALAAADGGLENPVTYHIGDTKTFITVNNAPVPTSWSGTSLTGKSIDEAMLSSHQMQCSSCHDVHKLVGSAPSSGILAKLSGNDVNGRGSILCRTCHIK